MSEGSAQSHPAPRPAPIEAFRRILLFVLLLLLQPLPGAAMAQAQLEEKRVALVIGNGNYTDIAKLNNAIADATLIARTLESLGFETTLVTDADQTAMKQAIANMGRTLRASGPETVGLFYYAGHGVQNSANINYLVPTDAVVADEVDLDIMAVPANWVLAQMESANNATNIIILDACRNNPFGNGMRAAARGLAPIDAPTGSFIAYSTAPGAVAADGNGENSPFTIALAEEMLVPGTPIEQMFKQVRVEVRQKTENTQTPYDSSSLVQDFFFNPALEVQAGMSPDTALWTSVKGSGDAKLVGLFLEAFPDGQHAPEAEKLLAELDPTGTIMKRAAGEGVALAPEPQQPETIAADGPVAPLEEPAPLEPALPADGARTEVAATQPAAPADVTRAAEVEAAPATFTAFETRFRTGSPVMLGRSIAELIKGYPLFTPMEGLDRSYWETQHCDGCHQWTKDALCTQAKIIASRDPATYEVRPHPLGPEFKTALAGWATGGCQ